MTILAPHNTHAHILEPLGPVILNPDSLRECILTDSLSGGFLRFLERKYSPECLSVDMNFHPILIFTTTTRCCLSYKLCRCSHFTASWCPEYNWCLEHNICSEHTTDVLNTSDVLNTTDVLLKSDVLNIQLMSWT